MIVRSDFSVTAVFRVYLLSLHYNKKNIHRLRIECENEVLLCFGFQRCSLPAAAYVPLLQINRLKKVCDLICFCKTKKKAGLRCWERHIIHAQSENISVAILKLIKHSHSTLSSLLAAQKKCEQKGSEVS